MESKAYLYFPAKVKGHESSIEARSITQNLGIAHPLAYSPPWKHANISFNLDKNITS
jgi:hypothetical protein